MDRYQIRVSINGANSAISYIGRAINHTTDENGFMRDASAEIQCGYKGASSAGLVEKLSIYSRDTGNQSNELSGEIRSIQAIISDLEYLDWQLAEQERREREEQERRDREESDRRDRETREARERVGW